MIDREAQRLSFAGKDRKRYAAAALTAAVVAAGVYLGNFYTGWLGIPGTGCMYFIEKGDLKENTWVKRNDGTYRRTDMNARMERGLYMIDDEIYMFGEDGAMKTGWQDTADGRMYFKNSGKAARGWDTVGGDRMYFDSRGILQTGWLELPDGTYYLGEDGVMRTGWQEITARGSEYPAGAAAETQERYFFDKNGIMQTGWHDENGAWYLLSDKGVMQTGDKVVDGHLYRLGPDGKMFTGWYETGKGKRYHKDSGEAAEGWTEIDGSTYFFGSDLLMKTGSFEDGDETYYLEDDGTVDPGWHESENGDFFVCSDGYVLDTEEDGGTFGRLVIRDAKINVAVNTASRRKDYQTIVDGEDSAVAVKERRDTEYVIADRRSQGFVLDNIKEGASAYILKNGEVESYECVRTCEGENKGTDVTDEDGDSVWKQNEDGFCTYSSAGTESGKVLIAFWQ